MIFVLVCSIVFTLFFLVFLFLSYFYLTANNLFSIFSLLCGVSATIAFGFWISFVFQKLNDKREIKINEGIKREIRNKEFSELRHLLSNIAKSTCSREDQLIHLIKGIKSSFYDNSIDIENLTLNYFIFKEVYANIKKYFKKEDDIFLVKGNIDALYFRDKFGVRFDNDVEHRVPEILDDFENFNQECIRLYFSMKQINLTYKFEIFSKEEIDAIEPFAGEINIGIFLNYYSPYEILKMYEKLIPIQAFICADLIPAYKKDNFWYNLEKFDANIKNYNKQIKQWINNNEDKAKSFLKDSYRNSN